MHTALVTIRDLGKTGRPVHVTRDEPRGIFVATMNVKSTRLRVVEALVDELTDTEQNLVRAGYGCGPIGTELPDWMVEDVPVVAVVPEPLRALGAPAVQGLDMPPLDQLAYLSWAADLVS